MKATSSASARFKRAYEQDKTVLPCEGCGSPVSFYGNDYPAHLLNGKRLCADCYEKAMAKAVFSCVDCEGSFPKSIGKNDRCPECWKAHLASLRERGRALYGVLESCLEKRGFKVLPIAEDCLDEYGMPLSDVPQEYPEGAIPLRKDTRGFYGGDERGIYAVRCKDAVIAIPSDGFGLRFLVPSADASFMKGIGEIRCKVAAIAGNAEALFLLHEDGRISSLPAETADFTMPEAAAETRELFNRFSQEDKERLERKVRESSFATSRKPYDDAPAAFTNESAQRLLEAVVTRDDLANVQIAVSPHLIEISGEYSETEWRALDDGFLCEHHYRLRISIESATRRRAVDLAAENASLFLRPGRYAPRYPKLQADSQQYYALGPGTAIVECPLGMEGIVIITEAVLEPNSAAPTPSAQ